MKFIAQNIEKHHEIFYELRVVKIATRGKREFQTVFRIWYTIINTLTLFFR